MATTMLALHQPAYGDLSTFNLSNLPVPTPSSTQILLRVHAAALNPIDVSRSYLPIVNEVFPVITGYDMAGIVISAGSSVTNFKSGDRVFGDIQSISMGPKTSGSVAEYCVAEEHMLALIPDGVTFIEAAALPVVACTAIQALESGGLKQGDNVFISGGAGGVGIHAIQIAKVLFGAREVATTASEGKMNFVRMYGADKVIDYKKEDAGEVLKGWADVVMDCTKDVEMGRKIVREGGKIVSIAAFRVEGILSVSLVPSRELIEKTARLLREGKLKAVVDSVYSLTDATSAIKHIAGGRSKGKVIVQVRDD